jgi:hypothetical protein
VLACGCGCLAGKEALMGEEDMFVCLVSRRVWWVRAVSEVQARVCVGRRMDLTSCGGLMGGWLLEGSGSGWWLFGVVVGRWEWEGEEQVRGDLMCLRLLRFHMPSASTPVG